MLEQLELTSLSQCRKFLKLTTMYNIINLALYIFLLATLCKIISHISVVILLITLDLLLVLILFVFIICPICYHFVE